MKKSGISISGSLLKFRWGVGLSPPKAVNWNPSSGDSGGKALLCQHGDRETTGSTMHLGSGLLPCLPPAVRPQVTSRPVVFLVK